MNNKSLIEDRIKQIKGLVRKKYQVRIFDNVPRLRYDCLFYKRGSLGHDTVIVSFDYEELTDFVSKQKDGGAAFQNAIAKIAVVSQDAIEELKKVLTI